jgi:hypothetical protein
MKTEAEKADRQNYMDNAAAYTLGICRDAELRGLSGYEVAVAIASVLAARNPTLAGKVLVAVGDAIRLNPVTKIIAPPADTVN